VEGAEIEFVAPLHPRISEDFTGLFKIEAERLTFAPVWG
jgi:hypothetical protein